MKIGFVILSHKEPNPNFIKMLRFLRSIEGSRISIHHDYSQSQFPDEITQGLGLEMVKDYRVTRWGHHSKVPATLDAFFQMRDEQIPDWFITLSPNCFPIKSADTILQFFKKSEHDTYIEYNEISKAKGGIYKWHYRNLFTRYLFSIPSFTRHGRFHMRPVRIPLRRSQTPFSDQFRPYTGSDWIALNRKAFEAMYEADLYNHPLLEYIKRANQAPDGNSSPIEIVLQSFFGNATGLRHGYKNLHFIDWHNAKDWHPNTLKMEHLSQILSSKALFARKFSEKPNDELIRYLENNVLT